MKRILYITLYWPIACLLIYCVSNSASANSDYLSWQSISDDIEILLSERIESQVHGDIDVYIKPLDERVKIKNCDTPLTYYIPPGSRINSRMNVHVSCKGQSSWNIHLPVTIRLVKPIVVATRPIAKNEVIMPDMVQLTPMNITQVHRAYFEDTNEVMNNVAKQPLRAGTIISPRHVEAPDLIKKGELVRIFYENRGLTIRTTGVAMGNAKGNSRILVKNTKTNRLVEAIVVRKGIVKIPL